MIGGGSMKYQLVGSTGVKVSKICLGTWQMSGDWGPNYEPAIQAVTRAFDCGINFFDTAYAYGRGTAERGLADGLGEIMKTHRDEVVISTKGGVDFVPGGEKVRLVRNSDSDFLRHTLQLSLRALGTDYVDFYFVHWPDPTVAIEETASVLAAFVDEGLVRYAGVSNFSLAQIKQFQVGGPIGVIQAPYSLFDHELDEEIVPYCVEQGIGITGYGGLAHGLLSGTMRRGMTFPEGDFRAHHPLFRGDEFERFMIAVDLLSDLAADHNCTLPQLALAWTIAGQAEIVPIIGAQFPKHIEDSAKAVEVTLSPSDMEALAAIAADAPRLEMGGESLMESREPGRSSEK
jgi:aryl-alcohol dehydrogenase-like predicted oxidoreductase